jgi:FkbM family methyltransferase
MTIKHVLGAPLLTFANSILGLMSLKIVSQRTPTRDFKAFFRHLRARGVDFRTVIDVGVAFGTPTLYQGFPMAKFYLVEPVPGCRATLDELTRKLNAEAFNVAAGAEDGVLDFFVHSDVSGSSGYRQWEGDFLDGRTISVPVRRLDSLIRAPLGRPSLLKIDTQGAELDVLAGATGILGEIDLLIVETSFHQFRKGAPEFNAIVTRLAELGFECYEVLEGHYRAVDNALAQVDLAFVQRDSDLRKVKSFFSQDQARRYLQE